MPDQTTVHAFTLLNSGVIGLAHWKCLNCGLDVYGVPACDLPILGCYPKESEHEEN